MLKSEDPIIPGLIERAGDQLVRHGPQGSPPNVSPARATASSVRFLIFGATISASGAGRGEPSRPSPPLPSKTPSEEKTGPRFTHIRTAAASVLPACDIHPASLEVKAKECGGAGRRARRPADHAVDAP
jgi:hypothetical protein